MKTTLITLIMALTIAMPATAFLCCQRMSVLQVGILASLVKVLKVTMSIITEDRPKFIEDRSSNVVDVPTPMHSELLKGWPVLPKRQTFAGASHQKSRFL
ncbi:hypothetical protein BJ170DRAFT_625788, partial [Xylariales sp. AK1849]